MTLTASLREFLNSRGSEIEVSGGITSQGGRPRSRSVASWTTKPATGERILLESLGADFVELFPSGISLGVNHRYCRQRFSAALAIRSCASTAGLSSIHRAGWVPSAGRRNLLTDFNLDLCRLFRVGLRGLTPTYLGRTCIRFLVKFCHVHKT